ncbi:hypothetical protein PS928_03206 [Pseudomonas fluorescens]|uniref:Uncharacterized protein n=1 Tax=Pseudomonas fluorescens TaxID=294 RepID=A0A5E7UHN8_PSEFL|nr:hypothetical protein PS928_03206 [Pseudomonas fluorescens]
MRLAFLKMPGCLSSCLFKKLTVRLVFSGYLKPSKPIGPGVENGADACGEPGVRGGAEGRRDSGSTPETGEGIATGCLRPSTKLFKAGMVLGSRAAHLEPNLDTTVSPANPNATNPRVLADSESPVIAATALATPVKADTIVATPATVEPAAPTVYFNGNCPAAPHCKASLASL